MGDVIMTFRVGNDYLPDYWKKQICFQSLFYARKDGGVTYELKIARDADFTDTAGITVKSVEISEPNEPEGNLSKWYKLDAVYQMEDSPAEEYVRLTVYRQPPDEVHLMGGAAMVDRADIDTRSVNIMDFDENNIVDFFDFALLANQWQYGYNMLDLECFAYNWLVGNDL